jgi:hypothetical protein
MRDDKIILSTKIEDNAGENGYEIIEVNISDPIENVYAVVTPINMK